MASVAGSAAGILGVTGLYGFLFYAGASALVSLLVLHQTRYATAAYFASPTAAWTEATGQGLLVRGAPPPTTCGQLTLVVVWWGGFIHAEPTHLWP